MTNRLITFQEIPPLFLRIIRNTSLECVERKHSSLMFKWTVHVITTIFWSISVHILKMQTCFLCTQALLHTYKARHNSPLYRVRTTEYVQKHDTTAHWAEETYFTCTVAQYSSPLNRLRTIEYVQNHNTAAQCTGYELLNTCRRKIQKTTAGGKNYWMCTEAQNSTKHNKNFYIRTESR